MAFDTHLLSIEEVWFVREHPLNITSVKVRGLVDEVEQLEELLESKRQELEAAVQKMNKRRAAYDR